MENKKFEYILIKSLILNPKNPRSIDKNQLAKLCDSLTQDPQFLESRPVLVNRVDQQNYVYAGTQRVRAAKKLGWKQIPCIIENDLDTEVMKRRVALDNIHAGAWDWDILANEYDPLDLIACGMLESELHLDAPDIDIEEEKGGDDNDTCAECGQKLKKKKGKK